MNRNRFSLAEVFQLRGKALAAIRLHAAAVDAIAAALIELDVAAALSIDQRSIDEQQDLIVAARRLSEALEIGVTK